MVPQTTPKPTQLPRHEPLFDVHPRTGASIEVFYADRTLETLGKGGAGWFWWSRWRGFAPGGLAHGPFAASYSAIGTLWPHEPIWGSINSRQGRHALGSHAKFAYVRRCLFDGY